jgi:sigma-E factor negative regulatory protein RseB
MTVRALRLPILSVVTVLSLPAWGAESAHEWLAKMAQAARQYDYEGTFVYRHESQLDTLRIVHKVVDGVARERLVSLSGVPREIVRDGREVRCYYPDDNSVVVEPRRAAKQNFPSILPEPVQALDENYLIQLGKSGRVAGRAAQQVLIRPRDSFRYGYHLWADRDTGLLLMADLVDDKDRMLEQFVFTQVNIGGNIPSTALAPQTERAGMVWHRDSGEQTSSSETSWIATRLPKGFKLSTQMKREVPARKKPVEHLVYSDGMATVSVFVEKREADGDGPGTSQMGAVNAFGTQVDGHYVTTVGEVPLATVSLIGASVARRP